ncbi:MAG: trigger factor [Clostridiales bacterium]|nr:trigger factor [Clostridiales bacterium]
MKQELIMKYTIEKAEKSTVKITIELNKEEWKGAIDTAYEKTKGKYSLPGFRKGKVPKNFLVSTYGEGIFYDDAINYAFPKYYGEILDKETTLEVIAQPEVEIKDLTAEGLTILATVAVKPEVKLGAYKGITYKKNVYNVTDEDVNEELTRLQERNSRLVDVTDRAVADGDTVIIDYSGSVDGVKFQGGTAEKQSLVIGSKTFIPGFEEQVIGMNIGEDRDINVKFPEEYHAEELKGKDAVFAIKLHEIKAKELPEINDEFIKDAVGTESVEAYKAETKARLEKQAQDRADRELEDEIIKNITKNTEVEIPEALIENQKDRMVQEMEYRLSYQGLKLDDYLKYIGKTMDDFRADYTEQATEYVKSQLVIEQIIADEKVDATEEDVEARVAEMAKAQGKEIPDVKKHMNARQLDYIKNDIIIKKLFDLLKSGNTIE